MSARNWTLIGLVLTTVFALIPTGALLDGAQLEPDDYRYLEHLERDPGLRYVLENDWEHIWWIEERPKMQFFRPTVYASFWIDGVDASPEARLTTNLVLHLLCALLVFALACRMLQPGLPAVLVGVVFAAFACHAETLWWVTGRNATLLAAGVLGGLLLHDRGTTSQRGAWRIGATIAFVFALGSKETALVMPILCWLQDRWMRRIRLPWRAYVPYGVVAVAYLVVRASVVETHGSGNLAPYVVLPWAEGFFAHLGTQIVAYLQALGSAALVEPFVTWDRLSVSWFGIGVFLGVVGAVVATSRGDRRAAYLGVMFVLCWFPAAPIYVDERYIYLSSAAFALAFGLLASRATGEGAAKWCVPLVIAGFGVFQLTELHARLRGFQVTRISTSLVDALEPVASKVPAGAPVYIVTFPGYFVSAQFLQPMLRVALDRPDLNVHVLSGISTGRVAITREDERTVVVRSDQPILEQRWAKMQWVDMRPGVCVEREALPFDVEVLEGDGDDCNAIRCRFEHPVSDAVFLQFEPGGAATRIAEWVEKGRFRVKRL